MTDENTILDSSSIDSVPPPQETVGLLAAWGRYPLLVAQSLKEQGYRVCCLGIKDHADAELADICDDFQLIGMAKFGAQIRYFRRQGVRRAVMAGKMHKVKMFQPFAILKHLPDWRGARVLYPHFVSGSRDRKDDTLLGVVVDSFAAGGVEMVPATDFMPELLLGKGQLSGRRVSTKQWQDIEFGWELAKNMGHLDVGQSVAVKGQAVLAVEAVEGTDACIGRAGELCTAGGFTVVKVAKPQQDMRFDVPTIGTGTIRTLANAGASVLAVEADRTIVLDSAEVTALADKHGITIVAVTDPAADRTTWQRRAA